MRRLLIGVTGLLGALAGGCNLLVDFSDLPAPKPVSPLGTCKAAPTNTPPEYELKLGLTFIENGGGAPSTAMTLRACPIGVSDPLSCTSPLGPDTHPDENGRAELIVYPQQNLSASYLPYVRVEKTGGYFPTSILTWPQVKRSAQLPPLIAISDTVVDFIVDNTPLEREADIDQRGHLIVVVTNCDGEPASNIEVVVDEAYRDEKTLPFTRGTDAIADFQPRSITDDDGIVVYLALPTSSEIVEVPLMLRDATNGQNLFRNPLNVPIRRGEATMVVVAPQLAG
ncbi:MAG: hypothetical protein MUF34_26860 [Polyangiaceae bacterium]|nr:hypothetical protein [Polyangiaceae bacterium]